MSYISEGVEDDAGCVPTEANDMNFYLDNKDLAQKGLKQFAEEVFSSDAGAHAPQAGIKAAARCQLEMWALASRRARAAMALPSQLAACKTPNEMLGAYVNFWQAALTESADTTKRISETLVPRVPVQEETEADRPAVPKVIRSKKRPTFNGSQTRYEEEYRQAS